MTNLQYLIDALTNQIDDGGAAWEASVYYYINCPYREGDVRAHCYPEEYRNGVVSSIKHKDCLTLTREMCVECKAKWLESEVDE